MTPVLLRDRNQTDRRLIAAAQEIAGEPSATPTLHARIYDPERPETAHAMAVLLADPARLQAFLRCLRERHQHAGPDTRAALEIARLETANPVPSLSAPTAPPPVVTAPQPAADCVNPS